MFLQFVVSIYIEEYSVSVCLSVYLCSVAPHLCSLLLTTHSTQVTAVLLTTVHKRGILIARLPSHVLLGPTRWEGLVKYVH